VLYLGWTAFTHFTLVWQCSHTWLR